MHGINDGSGTQNPDFGLCKCHGEMGLRQVEHGLSSFFAKFLTYLMIFQISGALKESLVQLALNPFFGWLRVPNQLLNGTAWKI